VLIGAFHFSTDYGIDVSELARALEERGLESRAALGGNERRRFDRRAERALG
jgi:hypothetical protein